VAYCYSDGVFCPFFIYVYTPLLKNYFYIGLVLGGLYLGFIFHAGYGAVEALWKRSAVIGDSNTALPTVWLLWISDLCYGFRDFVRLDPSWIYWIGSALALFLVFILLIARSESLPGIKPDLASRRSAFWNSLKSASSGISRFMY
jgi:OHS family lactose permease-like MFS transporter